MSAVSSIATNGGPWTSASDRRQQYGAVVQKLDQVAQQAKAEPKALAAVQLQTALDQYRVLKMMGGGLSPAQQAYEAERIGKQIKDAAQNYSGGVTAAGSTAPVSGSTIAPNVQAAAQTAGSVTAASAASTAKTVSEAIQLANDPGQFFALAFGALGGLRKIMSQATQTLDNDGNTDDHRLAQRLKRRLEDSVSATTAAAGQVSSTLQADGEIGSDEEDAAALTQTTVTTTVTTVSIQLGVNITA